MARWDYKTIDYEAIKTEVVAEDQFLKKLIAMASFVEITSDLYEKNLATFYEGDEEIVGWLEKTWEPEEVQHGKALREYVRHAWPELDWDKAYRGFYEEYAPLCTLDEFQPTRAREMLARMVVETGTSTLYRAIQRYAEEIGEPILAQIAHNIHKDEVYHYEAFDQGFKKYNESEKLGRKEIVKVVYDRLKEIKDEDAAIAFKQIAPGEDYEDFRKEAKRFAHRYYPYKMATKMLMHPLGLHRHIENATAATMEKALHVLGI